MLATVARNAGVISDKEYATFQNAGYMVDYEMGVTKVISYDIKLIDSDYFVEE